MAILDVEEVAYMSSHLLLKYMVFDTDISDGVAKLRLVIILVCIVHHHQCT